MLYLYQCLFVYVVSLSTCYSVVCHEFSVLTCCNVIRVYANMYCYYISTSDWMLFDILHFRLRYCTMDYDVLFIRCYML